MRKVQDSNDACKSHIQAQVYFIFVSNFAVERKKVFNLKQSRGTSPPACFVCVFEQTVITMCVLWTKTIDFCVRLSHWYGGTPFKLSLCEIFFFIFQLARCALKKEMRLGSLFSIFKCIQHVAAAD